MTTEILCELCHEPVDLTKPHGTYHGDLYWHVQSSGATSWDACMWAATGNDARLMRVHKLFAQDEPLMARAWDGDR